MYIDTETTYYCCPGYEKISLFSNRCKPVCSESCLHSNCTLPEVCICWDGYHKSDNKYVCVPHCEKKCINSSCLAPNYCGCNTG